MSGENTAEWILPTTAEDFQRLLSEPRLIEKWFTRDALDSGATSDFLKLYSAYYVTTNDSADERERFARAYHEAFVTGLHKPLRISSISGAQQRYVEAYFLNGAQSTCRHRNAMPVEDLAGEVVAALCPDCDQQLPPECVPEPPRDFEAEHRKDHHGYWSVFLLACRLCAEECR